MKKLVKDISIYSICHFLTKIFLQEFIKAERTGFTVVEWGGTEVK